MALINCPECGRENVSDSAESCPNCGYGIKAHFEKIKAQEEKIRKEEERKVAEQQRQERRLKNIKPPEKPIFSIGLIVYIIIAITFLSWLFLYTPTTRYDDPDVGHWILELAVFIGLPLVIYLPNYIKRVNDYELAKSDFEEYQKQVIKEQDDAAKRAELERIRQMNAPKCPHCNSTNIERITTVDRAVSIGMTGLASGKIGKQYKCKSCKHMW